MDKTPETASAPAAKDVQTAMGEPEPESKRGLTVDDLRGGPLKKRDTTDQATVMGLPMAMFMKGGRTPTHAHEMAVASAHADSEKRRDVADAERRIASVPIAQGGGKMLGGRLNTPDPIAAYVLLTYTNERREPLMFRGKPIDCLADIVEADGDLALMIFCLSCKKRDEPLDHCILRIFQKNRSWHLDTRTSGEMIFFDGALYRSAGTIMDSERFSCVCGWAAHIDRNQIVVEARS